MAKNIAASKINKAKSALDNMVKDITSGLNLDEATSKKIMDRLASRMEKALKEGEFYRRVSEEMLSGVQKIFKEANDAKANNNINKEDANKLFSEASKQLDEILATTEDAANKIMEIVERQLEAQEEFDSLLTLAVEKKLTPDQTTRLHDINEGLSVDLTSILTSLSFQDLTGQRIKKVFDALKKIETSSYELFMTTGLALKAHQKEPEKDAETIKTETQQVVSDLKGPTLDSNQQNVDDLLAELGL